MKTKNQIIQAFNEVAKEYDAKIHLGTEDGFTWLTIYGGSINPKIFDTVTSKMSQESGVDCYFNKCMINGIEMAVNAKIGYEVEDNDVPLPYEKSRIEEYGTLFK